MTTPPQRYPHADAAAVAGLAHEVEQLRRTVDELARLPGELAQLAATVASLSDAVGGGARRESPAGAPSWLAYPSDADDPAATTAARTLLTALAEWVRAVYLRYQDAVSRFPECWLWHPDVVEELLWLRAAWQAAYALGASINAAGDWHDRQRPMVVHRIRDYAGVCSLEAHQAGRSEHRPSPTVPHPEAIDAIAQWWTTRRTEPAPPPSQEQLAASGRHWHYTGWTQQ